MKPLNLPSCHIHSTKINGKMYCGVRYYDDIFFENDEFLLDHYDELVIDTRTYKNLRKMTTHPDCVQYRYDYYTDNTRWF